MVHYNAKPTIQDKIHCVVYVVDSNSVEVMSSNITQQYKQMADMAFGKGKDENYSNIANDISLWTLLFTPYYK